MTMSRRQFLTTTAAAAALPLPGFDTRPRPSPSQRLWQRDELALFLHFGVNTFSDREWGDGTEPASLFAPTQLDPRQWARTARAAGFRAMILTAKHHDGFCLWPTATTKHAVTTRDVVREFTEACRAEGLRAGVYLSPWDRNSPVYGDSPRYGNFYCDQLTELLTRYGAIHEVWFDGANGEGPNGRRQEYDWPRYWGLVRRLQPNAVMFSDAGPDVRWIGNEVGVAGDPNWSTVDPAAVPYPGASGEGVIAMLQHGDPHGSVWRPGETDVSIRPGWFYHPAEDERVKSVDDLVGLYFTSVGRNSKLLLNVPPTREGLLHPTDASRLLGMRARLDGLFSSNLVNDVRAGRARMVSVADLREDITRGQSVARYTLRGRTANGWQVLSQGTTIGARKLDRFEPTSISGIRLTIDEAVGGGSARPARIGLYHQASL